jgi:hypothetical protein
MEHLGFLICGAHGSEMFLFIALISFSDLMVFHELHLVLLDLY